MNNRFGSVPGWTGYELLESERLSPEMELRHLRNVTGSLLQEALSIWAALWAEVQDRVTSGIMVLPETERGFKPQCGWPEFLEKMWQLKFYLNSAKGFNEQGP